MEVLKDRNLIARQRLRNKMIKKMIELSKIIVIKDIYKKDGRIEVTIDYEKMPPNFSTSFFNDAVQYKLMNDNELQERIKNLQ